MARLVSRSLRRRARGGGTQRLLRDERLHEICADIHSTRESLRHYSRDVRTGEFRINEYQKLLSELECELATHLESQTIRGA